MAKIQKTIYIIHKEREEDVFVAGPAWRNKSPQCGDGRGLQGRERAQSRSLFSVYAFLRSLHFRPSEPGGRVKSNDDDFDGCRDDGVRYNGTPASIISLLSCSFSFGVCFIYFLFFRKWSNFVDWCFYLYFDKNPINLSLKVQDHKI